MRSGRVFVLCMLMLFGAVFTACDDESNGKSGNKTSGSDGYYQIAMDLLEKTIDARANDDKDAWTKINTYSFFNEDTFGDDFSPLTKVKNYQITQIYVHEVNIENNRQERVETCLGKKIQNIVQIDFKIVAYDEDNDMLFHEGCGDTMFFIDDNWYISEDASFEDLDDVEFGFSDKHPDMVEEGETLEVIGGYYPQKNSDGKYEFYPVQSDGRVEMPDGNTFVLDHGRIED